MPSITLGMPIHGDIKPLTTFSLIGAVCVLRESGIDVHLSVEAGPYVGWNRDALVRDAINAGTSHLMMVDSDMVFPPDGMIRLLKLDKPVVGGFYMMRFLPPTNTVKMSDGNGGYLAEKDWTPPAEPFRCAALGTGFMLINLAAIEKIERPLFPMEPGVGEDVAFCEKVNTAGLEVWCDPTFELKHLGEYAY